MTQRTPAAPPQLAELVGSARWLVHQVNLTGGAELVEMTPEAYAASSFLDHRIKFPDDARVALMSFAMLHPLFQEVGSHETRFISHISHVGSTLLSKAIGSLDGVLSLREPVLLRWLAEVRRDLRLPESRYDAAGYTTILRTVLGLLARPLDDASTVVVKATSYANILADDILSLQPRSRAIGLFCRFESFAATILRGGGGWIDVLQMAPARMRRLHDMLGRQPWQLAYMSPGEIIALNWLAEMATLASAHARHADRFQWIDFDRFLAGGGPQFSGAAAALGLACTDENFARLRESGVLSTYSKDDRLDYDAQARERAKREAEARHGGEIRKGRAWLDRALEDHREFKNLRPFAEQMTAIAA